LTSILAEVLAELAPTGIMRVAINQGNVVLAQKDPVSGEPRGVTVDLALTLAKRLGVAQEFVVFDAAGKAFEALKAGKIDVAFLAVDPVRATEIEFTAPYVQIEGVFMVPDESAIKTVTDVDCEGNRIAVARGSAYELFLSRTIKNATLVRSASGPDAMNIFVTDKLEVGGGVRQQVIDFINKTSGLRMIEPAFMKIEQAMGTPKGRLVGTAYLSAFIEEQKSSGRVADGLERSGQSKTLVAP
jgi:polar amino acid transport system substrate-binding protein